MKKTTLLGFINLVLSIWFGFILVKSSYVFAANYSLYALIRDYSSAFIIFLFLLLNGYLTYFLLWTQPKKPSYPVIIALTFAPLFWFVFAFIGFFFASQLLLPVFGIVCSVVLYLYCRKFSNRTALFLSLGTIVVLGIVLLSSFEEDYCWKRGDLADPSGTKFIAATKDDAKKLEGYGVTPGQEIGVAFRAHMLCHETFNPLQAVKQSYFHK